MTDVHDLLARTHDALGEAEAPLDATRHGDLLSGIRRRRRRRHAGEALGVGVVVVVLGAGGWLGLQRDAAPQPAQRPTATATPAPTGAATPDPDAQGVPAPGAPGLVPALVMPPGTLEATTSGWVMVAQQPSYFTSDDRGSAGPTASVLDVVDPAGTRYRVLDLPPDLPMSLVRWDAGRTDALVTTREGEGERQGARLDLLTGELTPLEGLLPVSGYVGRTADGHDLWTDELSDRMALHDGTAVVRELPFVHAAVLDPSGARVAGVADGAVVLVDVASGEVTEVARPTAVDCRPMGWRVADLLVVCEEFVDSAPVITAVVRYDTTAPVLEPVLVELDRGMLPTGTAWPLADGRLAVQHTLDVECAHGWGILDVDAATLAPVPVGGDDLAVTVQGAGQVVLVWIGGQCSGDGGPVRLVRHDVVTGAQLELSVPPPDADLPAGGTSWITATSDAVLASTP